MALGDSSPFAPVDLLGGLVTNVVATNFACKNHSFRVGIPMGEKKEIPAYLDYRFLGGVAAGQQAAAPADGAAESQLAFRP